VGLVPSAVADEQIYDPAPLMLPTGSAAVVEDVGVVASGVLQRVGEDRQAVEGTFRFDPTGQRDDGGCEPSGVQIRLTRVAVGETPCGPVSIMNLYSPPGRGGFGFGFMSPTPMR
jgi:hypothetical protein